MNKTADTLLSTLKRHSPARVRAYAGDDDARDIAVPTRRTRWGQVIEAINARSWSRVELLDKSGAVLAYVENSEPAREVEDIDGGKVSKTRAEVEWIVNLVVRAQREAVALARERDADAHRELAAAFRDMAAIYREQRDIAADTAAMQAAAESGHGQVKELLEAAPAILQMLPVIRSLASPAPGKPKNGA